MKKLILSLAVLAFATLLFSQGDSNDNKDTVKQNEAINTQTEFIAFNINR